VALYRGASRSTECISDSRWKDNIGKQRPTSSSRLSLQIYCRRLAFSATRVVLVARRELHSEIALARELRNRPFSSVRVVVWRWMLRIECNVAMLGCPRGVLAPLTGLAVRWFTFVNHGKFLDVISGNLSKELWKARTTLLFDGKIVFDCHVSLLRRFAIGKLHAPSCHVFCLFRIGDLVRKVIDVHSANWTSQTHDKRRRHRDRLRYLRRCKDGSSHECPFCQ
jgi:hypothetical protein